MIENNLTYKPKKEKNNFVIFHNKRPILYELSYEEKGQLFEALFEYSINKNKPNFKSNGKLSIAFITFQTDIDNSDKAYIELCKNNKKAIDTRYKKLKHNYDNKLPNEINEKDIYEN